MGVRGVLQQTYGGRNMMKVDHARNIQEALATANFQNPLPANQADRKLTLL